LSGYCCVFSNSSVYFPRYCDRRGGRSDLKLEYSSGTDFFFFSSTHFWGVWVKEKKRKRNKPFRCKIQLNNVYLLVTQNSIFGGSEKGKGKKTNEKTGGFFFHYIFRGSINSL